MEIITIDVRSTGMVVMDGAMQGSRAQWYAPGLEIRVRGPLPVKLYDRACNIACNEAIARHIPAIKLVRVTK